MDPDIKELEIQLNERFAQLPKVVQNAITSAGVGKRLRELADTYKLHLDQWQTLENEVMLTLLGFQKTENLEENLKKEVGIPAETASALVSNIAEMVFHPIRKELERGLESPLEKEERINNTKPVEQKPVAGLPADLPARNAEAGASAQAGSPQPVAGEPILNTEYQIPNTVPAQAIIDNLPPRPVEPKAPVPAPVASTPPPAPPIEKSIRAPISSAYTSQAPSHERKVVEGDPYREAIG